MRNEFKKRVITAIHGLPYEKAIEREFYEGCVVLFGEKRRVIAEIRGHKNIKLSGYGDQLFAKNELKTIGYPITIPRFMKACRMKSINIHMSETGQFFNGKNCNTVGGELFWKLTKENGQECTADDQTDETIEALLEVLKC